MNAPLEGEQAVPSEDSVRRVGSRRAQWTGIYIVAGSVVLLAVLVLAAPFVIDSSVTANEWGRVIETLVAPIVLGTGIAFWAWPRVLVAGPSRSMNSSITYYRVGTALLVGGMGALGLEIAFEFTGVFSVGSPRDPFVTGLVVLAGLVVMAGEYLISTACRLP